MKSIAIIGGGLSGLALSYYALRFGLEVTLFEKREIGDNTSGSASGLMHPFPGFMSRITPFEEEGRRATRSLILESENYAKIELMSRKKVLRVAYSPEQKNRLKELSKERSDVLEGRGEYPFLVEGGDVYEISSADTIYTKEYLKALYRLCTSLGMKTKRREVKDLQEILPSFDHVILAAGYEVAKLIDLPFLKAVKGQILLVNIKEELPSLLGKGYLAASNTPYLYHLGSTYEHDFNSADPDPLVAKNFHFVYTL